MSYEKISLKQNTYVTKSVATKFDKCQDEIATQNPFEKKQEENIELKNKLANIDIDKLAQKYKKILWECLTNLE